MKFWLPGIWGVVTTHIVGSMTTSFRPSVTAPFVLNASTGYPTHRLEALKVLGRTEQWRRQSKLVYGVCS